MDKMIKTLFMFMSRLAYFEKYGINLTKDEVVYMIKVLDKVKEKIEVIEQIGLEDDKKILVEVVDTSVQEEVNAIDIERKELVLGKEYLVPISKIDMIRKNLEHLLQVNNFVTLKIDGDKLGNILNQKQQVLKELKNSLTSLRNYYSLEIGYVTETVTETQPQG